MARVCCQFSSRFRERPSDSGLRQRMRGHHLLLWSLHREWTPMPTHTTCTHTTFIYTHTCSVRVTDNCHLSTSEVKAGGPEVQGQPGLHEVLSQPYLFGDLVVYTYDLSTQEVGTDRSPWVQGHLSLHNENLKKKNPSWVWYPRLRRMWYVFTYVDISCYCKQATFHRTTECRYRIRD